MASRIWKQRHHSSGEAIGRVGGSAFRSLRRAGVAYGEFVPDTGGHCLLLGTKDWDSLCLFPYGCIVCSGI